MPVITDRRSYNGFDSKIDRLGLDGLVAEVDAAITGFRLEIQESRHANGTRQIREMIDRQFGELDAWRKITVGGVARTNEVVPHFWTIR